MTGRGGGGVGGRRDAGRVGGAVGEMGGWGRIGWFGRVWGLVGRGRQGEGLGRVIDETGCKRVAAGGKNSLIIIDI